MGAKSPRDSVIAVVGEGFGSLLVHTTGRYLGFTNKEITVFGHERQSGRYLSAVRLQPGPDRPSSESESHFLAPDWPTFAQIDALAHRSPAPLWRSITRKYNPGVTEILTEAAVVHKRMGWEESRVPLRIGWVQREMNPMPHFVLYDEQANFVGRAKHVMLAPGHGPLSFPPMLAKARKDPRSRNGSSRPTSQSSTRPDGRYIVLGAGIASVNEWANILDIGGSVLALTRNPQPETQDLNVPRCLFESRGDRRLRVAALRPADPFLGEVLRGTRPDRKAWLQTIEDGRKEGRFDALVGEITQVEAGRAGLRTTSRAATDEDPGWLDVTGVTAGTGFNKSVLTIPLLRRLIEHYKRAGPGGTTEAADQLRGARARPARTHGCAAWA